ncbi:hypothetical protein ACIP39_11770 [Streptomyces tibetensis]|uniref:hypothetical protein n=1 Tax=Streptomyces tibetensis TaxID=2382123 RepID=UPI003829FFD0
MQSVEVREAWAQGVYSNFSVQSCIGVETEARRLAREIGDESFAAFLSLNIARRKARATGDDLSPTIAELRTFSLDARETYGGPASSLIGSIAIRVLACAASYTSSWADIMGISPEDIPAEKSRLFGLAEELIASEPSAADTLWVGREARAALTLARINEDAMRNMPYGNVARRLDQHIETFDDYLPTYFDRANHARRHVARGLADLSSAQVIGYFEETVRAAVAQSDRRHEPNLRGISNISEDAPGDVVSGLSLARRELELAQDLFTSRESEQILESLEGDRFQGGEHA